MRDFHQAVTAITKQVVSLVDKNPTPIILIDGRAASGKSSLAADLKNALFKELEQAPRLIHMDDLYPGWEGLQLGSYYLNQQILQPLSNGKTANWQLWDWQKAERGRADEPGNGWREFAGGTPLIVEGCGALSRVSSELAHFRVWIEAPKNFVMLAGLSEMAKSSMTIGISGQPRKMSFISRKNPNRLLIC